MPIIEGAVKRETGGLLVTYTTANLPAAGSVTEPAIYVEDNGPGDQNLIIYAGGQRFRVDTAVSF